MAYNKAVDKFRDIEYPMMQGKTYLDHGGTTIYAKSLVEEFSQKMISNLYGNPHSASDPALLSGQQVDSIREQALRFFGADPEHFDLVFTANATAAIKLVAEAFRDLAAPDSLDSTFWYGYHKDAHTSLVGVRELTHGNHHCFSSDDEVDDWLNNIHVPTIAARSGELPGLFAYPGQSNMTGRRLPLSWTKRLRQSSNPTHQITYSLLDAAALATTAQLDLSDPEAAPDFTALSFYKIFGFPDLGALIVRKASGHILSWRKYFGGGTVNSVEVLHEASVQRKDQTIHDAVEDGTLPFHNIIALGCAMEIHTRLYGSMKKISEHTSFLAYRLYQGMASLSHFNGSPVCVIYNDCPDRSVYGDPVTQGGTVAFNIMQADGSYVGHATVEGKANESGIYLRSGGLCNAGGIADYLQMERWQFKRNWSAGYRCGASGDIMIISGKPTGVVRVSIGAMTTIADVDTFLNFLAVAYAEAGPERGSADTSFIDDLGVVHLGLEFMKSRDVGFDVGHQQLPRMKSPTSSPNLRSPITTKLNSSISIYDRRDAGAYRVPRTTFPIQSLDTAASKISSYERGYQAAINELHAPPAPMYQRRPEAARSKLAVNDGFSEFALSRGELGGEHMNIQKGRTLLKFWKSRKARI